MKINSAPSALLLLSPSLCEVLMVYSIELELLEILKYKFSTALQLHALQYRGIPVPFRIYLCS